MLVLLANIRKLSIIIIPYSLNKQKEVFVLQVKAYRLSTRIKNRRGSSLATGSIFVCLASGSFPTSSSALAFSSALASLACLLCRNIVAAPTVTPYFSSK